MEDLYEKLAEILDVETVKDDDTLTSFEEWDSIAVISFLSYLDKKYNARLTTNEIRECKTVGDLIAAVKSKAG